MSQRSNAAFFSEKKKNHFHGFFFLQFELTSTPWEEDCTPLIETLQSMVSSILRQNQMKDPSAQKHRQLTLEQRIDKMKTQLDEKTK